MKPAYLCQVGDCAWEVRAESGALCAFLTFDAASGNFYVSAGDFDCEFFGTFREACAYAFGGAT